MKLHLLILLSCISFSGFSQDISGIWRGYFQAGSPGSSDLFAMLDRYKFEVQVDQQNKNFDGVTYSYKTTQFYGKASCKGTVNAVTHKVMLEELKLLEVRMAGPDEACVMTCFLQYAKRGDDEFLEGTWFGTNVRDSTPCDKGTILLRKVPSSDFYEEPFLAQRKKEKTAPKKVTPPPVTPKKDEIAKAKPPVKQTPPPVTKKDPEISMPLKEDAPPPPASTPKVEREVVPVPKDLKERENELVKTITTSANTIQIAIYDNGTIDNDTVTVYMDNKVVLFKKRLTDKALTMTVNLDKTQDSHEVVMVADNLGEFPPNTSLMVVTAGDQKYEVHISSNEKTNAVIRFRYSGD